MPARRPPAAIRTSPAGQPSAAPPGFSGIERLKRRAEFLAAARGFRASAPSLLLQGRPRGPGEDGGGAIRVGFTCSRKVGNAVRRNRARRRLREAARLILSAHGRPGWDYVLVGRREVTEARPFHLLLEDLRRALARLHREADRKTPADREKPADRPADRTATARAGRGAG